MYCTTVWDEMWKHSDRKTELYMVHQQPTEELIDLIDFPPPNGGCDTIGLGCCAIMSPPTFQGQTLDQIWGKHPRLIATVTI